MRKYSSHERSAPGVGSKPRSRFIWTRASRTGRAGRTRSSSGSRRQAVELVRVGNRPGLELDRDKVPQVPRVRQVGIGVELAQVGERLVVRREHLVGVGEPSAYAPCPRAKSSATFWTIADSSSWMMLTVIPVRSVNGLRFAAMADVGDVFSLMKFSVVPAKRRQGSAPRPGDPGLRAAASERERGARRRPRRAAAGATGADHRVRVSEVHSSSRTAAPPLCPVARLAKQPAAQPAAGSLPVR